MSAADDVRAAMMELTESLAPVYEMAEGQKAELVRRGWSPAVAEQVASVTMMHMINTMLGAKA